MLTSPKKIQILPEHIIDQIKAGEVVEKASTLLKELLENSIDAGADSISIEIINNGLDLISVSDNGDGMDYDDLSLAFCRHATSKIISFEDIYNLSSYGFRGEALASMASVSKITCTSNRGQSPMATIKIHGGEVIAHYRDDEFNEKSGTAIYIKDLFYNTPVRMKFLSSQTAEKNQLKRILNAFLLTHPSVEMSIKWDNGEKVYFPRVNSDVLEKRIKDTIKKNINLAHIHNQYNEVTFNAYISFESSRGNMGKFHYLFVNKRLVTDIQIHKIILNCAAHLWPHGETGHYCAFIELPSDRIDVNVHPNKTVIKFFQASDILSLIANSIKKGLPQNIAPQVQGPQEQELSFDASNSEPHNFGPVEYRRHEFSEEQDLADYLSKLDSPVSRSDSEQSEHQNFNLLAIYGNFLLVSYQSNFYFIDGKLLFLSYLEEKLYHSSTELMSTPLLVSYPLKNFPSSLKNKLDEFQKFGFEIDFLDGKTAVLRTFPTVLNDYPFQEVLEQYISTITSKTVLFKNMDFALQIKESWKHYYFKLLNYYGLTGLSKIGACKKITEDIIGHMYEK